MSTYVGRVGPFRITTREGSGLCDVILLSGTSARLDEVEMAALVRVMREAQRRGRVGHGLKRWGGGHAAYE